MIRIKDQGLQKGRKTERCSDIGKMLQRQGHHGQGKQTRYNAMEAEKKKKDGPEVQDHHHGQGKPRHDELLLQV